jgi:Protein of unknown function (DUF2726)
MIFRQVFKAATRPESHAAPGNWPVLAEPLLTPREREFHRLLVAAYPHHFIFAQVALSQLIAVRPGVFNSELLRSRYKQLVADFVLCRSDYSIVAVIELDDLSHMRPDRQNADQRKTRAVLSAGLRLVRIPAGPIPDGARLRQLVDAVEAFTDVRQSTPKPAVSPRAAVPRHVFGLLIGVAAIAGAAVLFSAERDTSPKLSITPEAIGEPSVRQRKPKRVEPERKLATDEDAVALRTRKEAAWAAYYQPSISCENPPTQREKIECGNRYLSARREFEVQWSAAPRPIP